MTLPQKASHNLDAAELPPLVGSCLRLIIGAIAALLLAGACPLMADTPSFDPRVEQWETQELVMRSAHEYANPVTDVRLTCRFQSGGQTVTVDGFYDGGRTWKIRFMPEAQGDWTFTTASNDADLNAKTGKFSATAPGRGNHGPIRVAKTYHFSYADGTPYFLLGTTTYGGLSGGAAGRIATVRKLADSPFNKSRFMLLGMSRGPGGGSNSPFELKPDGSMDYSRPNPRYYDEVEHGLRDLRTLGIEADLILFVPYGPPGSTSSMGEANDIIYLKYAVARLAAFRNVWWTLTNEYDVNRVRKDNQKLGTLVRESDPYKHVIGIHQCCLAFYDNTEPWITHYLLQDLTLQRLAAEPRNDAFLELDARKVGKPVLVDEYGYEGNNGAAWGAIGPREMVEQHWAITMSGAYASHGESYAVSQNADRFVGDSPKRLGFLKQILMEAPFQDMEPASDIVRLKLPEKNPNPAYVVTALAKRGSYYLIHFPEPKEAYTWNLGVYGPATPSQPLPPPDPSTAPPSTFDAPAEIDLGEGIFRVDLIDTWLMNVRTIGYAKGPRQSFRTPIAPGIIRFVKVDQVPDGAPVGDVSELSRRRP